MWSVITIPSPSGRRVPRNAEPEADSGRPGDAAGGGGVLVIILSNSNRII